MQSLKIAVLATAQGIWIAIRTLGRAALGEERFDRLIDRTGLREFKSRTWLSSRTMPDGNVILYRPHDQCIVDEVYSKDVYARERIRPGETVVDVGAHIGTFALMAGRCVGPSGRVLAFEPSPKSFELLQKNIAANRMSWIAPQDFALADAEATAELFVADDAANNPAADTLHAQAGRKAVAIRLRRLDDVLAEKKIERVDLLKIDVEGAELRVLDGAPKSLPVVRRIVMEVHPPAVSPTAVRSRLEALGFSCRIVSEAADSVILEAVRA
jgi:FkbM family methyltransferase